MPWDRPNDIEDTEKIRADHGRQRRQAVSRWSQPTALVLALNRPRQPKVLALPSLIGRTRFCLFGCFFIAQKKDALALAPPCRVACAAGSARM
jgi:hypothetical protein